MQIDRLYQLTEKDYPRMVEILTQCFRQDPLYCELIPDPQVRERTLPEIFGCDVNQMLEDCRVYAESPAINGLIFVSDEREPYNPLEYYANEAYYALKTDAYLIKEDLSLRTLFNFLRGTVYLNSRWTDKLLQDKRLHIIYLAVSPEHQGEGISHRLMDPVLEYADGEGLLTSLETHNVGNIPFYEHYGFELFKTVQAQMELKQYCMLRPCAGKSLSELLPPQVIAQEVPGLEL